MLELNMLLLSRSTSSIERSFISGMVSVHLAIWCESVGDWPRAPRLYCRPVVEDDGLVSIC